MDWKNHCFRVRNVPEEFDDIPSGADLERFIAHCRKQIEPWLSAVFQSDHLNLLIGSGLTTAIGHACGKPATGMATVTFGTTHDERINAHAISSATAMKRGSANIEDQFRSALAVYEGLLVINPTQAETLKKAMDTQLSAFLTSLLQTEAGIAVGNTYESRLNAENLLQSFLLSFASRVVSRERLHIFTTNYDRLIEHGCDLSGLRIMDRFVGMIDPTFRASRVDVDMHYNPPGIRGEPRYIEGVVRLTKLHGSLDWIFDKAARRIHRKGIPFGAPISHTDVPKNPIDTVMIYPNPAKDVETTLYPYAELFRDFAASVCRSNAVVVTYGYGFGDDHVNRVLLDMLTIPSTHLVIIARSADVRIKEFCVKAREAQISLLLGPHFADLSTLVHNYLPKPTLDVVTPRLIQILGDRMRGGLLPPDRPAEVASITPAGGVA